VLPTPPLDFVPALPEVILTAVALLVLLYEALAPRASARVHLAASLAGLAGAAAASLAMWSRTGPSTVLAGAVQVDRFAVVARLIVLASAAMALMLGTHYYGRSGDEPRGEFFPLVLFATAGMTLIIAAADLIVVFLALEVLSLSLYVLAGLSRRGQATEASMKYFLLGAFSSAFFLYGVALAYGATGSTKIASIAHALAGNTGSQAMALAAFGFLAVGFAFKVSAVPFHMWTPDVYQGAPTPVTAFMAAATKVAGFGALVRVLDVSFQPLSWDWRPLVWVVAALSVVLGSILAIAQTDVKRMLAYSSISHAGFILTGLTASSQDGIRAALFYMVAYAAMTLGSFGVVMLVSARGEEQTSLASYAGLGRRQPLLAAMMALFLLSLAGIPPTAGFIAKVAVFGAAIRAGYWPLALIGVLASVAAAYFYLRVIVLMYMQEPQGDQEQDDSLLPRVALGIPAFVTLLLGVFPQTVLRFLDTASVLRW
jgi:NADH-quinone oxidoreductase subunit N